MKVLVLFCVFGLHLAFGQGQLPRATAKDLTEYPEFQKFMAEFLKQDAFAAALLSPSNRAIYGEGFRPVLGLPNDPDAKFGKSHGLQEYFVRKVYCDIANTTPLSRASLAHFVDFIGAESDKTLIAVGKVIKKYDLRVEGAFNFRREFGKVRDPEDLKTLKTYWLNDAVLGTELRVLAWVYQSFYGTPYISPEKRKY